MLTGKWHNNTTKQLVIKDKGSLVKEATETATLLNSYFVNSVKMTVHLIKLNLSILHQ